MLKRYSVVILFCITTIYVHQIVCPPVLPDKKEMTDHDINKDDPLIKLEYSRYLKEVVNVLESDPSFKKMIENASVDDIKSGKISEHLDLVSHHVRTQLNELKRLEIERLTKLLARSMKLKQMKPEEIETILPKHIDHQDISFGMKDLEKLIKQATFDLEELDKQRREEFKEHELEKEYERREALEKMDAEHRKKAEEEHQKEMEARKHHPKVNHPGSEDQLEEVWKEQDHLEESEFDPKTFFHLHDLNNDNLWDEYELMALFQVELDKIYNTSAKDFDPRERDEEMNRMREHVMKEIDTNGDRMVSIEEFIASTQQKEFKKNDEWKTIEDEPQFDAKEFENFSQTHHQADMKPPTQPATDHPSTPVPGQHH